MNTASFKSIRSFADIMSLTDVDYQSVYRMLKEDKESFFARDKDLKIILTYEALLHFIETEQYAKCTILERSIEYIHAFAFNKQDELLMGNAIDIRSLNYTSKMLERILAIYEGKENASKFNLDKESDYFTYCFTLLQIAKGEFYKGHLRSALIVSYEMYLYYFRLDEMEKCRIVKESLFCFEP